jgi:DHA1 family tetracycline resistance protein-like MFS transporter
MYAVIFIGFVGYSLMITVFTPMLLDPHDAIMRPHARMARRTITLGVLLSLYPLGQFFGSPVVGALSDRYGRKPTLLLSLCATTLCYALIAAAVAARRLPLLMAGSLLAGLSEANIVIAQSAIADVTTADSRTRLFGYIYLSASLAYVVGPLAGGKLADSSLMRSFNYATPFWAVFGLLVVTLLWTAAVFRETHAPQPGGDAISFGTALNHLLDAFIEPGLRQLYVVNAMIYLAIFGFFRCYPMYLVDQFRLGVSQVSEFIAWVAVPIVIANLWLTNFLAGRVSTRRIVIASALLTGVFMLTVAFPLQQRALWVTLFFTALPLAVCLPACATMISTAASAEEQGRAMGANQSLQVGAEALSGVLGGMLAAVRVPLPLVVLGLVALCAGMTLARLKPAADQ